MYSPSFTVKRKKFCLSLPYNGDNSYLFVNDTEVYKFKAKDFSVSNMKKIDCMVLFLTLVLIIK